MDQTAYEITPQQFIDENYTGKIERGACEVFVPYPKLQSNADDIQKWAYDELLRIAPKGSSIKEITKNEDESYDAHTIPHGIMLIDDKTKLHVWLK